MHGPRNNATIAQQDLRTALYREPTASDLRGLPAVETLRQVWIQNVATTDGQL
jgi:hypothetical protein